jgi:hypothetical protein
MTAFSFFRVVCLGLVMVGGACALPEPDDEVGKVCTSDLDCPEDMECVLADSPNATRVCMPLE